MIFKPGEPDSRRFYQLLTGSVAPRPICFASTIDKDGKPNLSPFSFFNLFGSNPPLLIFSPLRRLRNNTIKHTLENIYEHGEVVVNVVTYSMVQQASLASCEYPKGTNEFEKAGFTPLPSEIVKPARVKESPVNFECRVLQVIETGRDGGAGNLILCKILLMHVQEHILDGNGFIDPQKIDLVGRMGRDYYCRASGTAVFEVEKPQVKLGIGIDALPPSIRHSRILTGNHLGQLGNVHEMPLIDPAFDDNLPGQIIRRFLNNPETMEAELHRYAAELLDQQQVTAAWQVLLRGMESGKWKSENESKNEK